MISDIPFFQLLEEAGFVSVNAEDRTWQFIEALEGEKTRVENIKEEFMKVRTIGQKETCRNLRLDIFFLYQLTRFLKFLQDFIKRFKWQQSCRVTL